MTVAAPHGMPVVLPRRPGPAVLSVRALRYWLLAYRRTWRASVWSSVFGPLFYLGAMGYGLGSLVDKTGADTLGGVPYVVFVAPAVLVAQSMNTGLSSGLFPVFGSVHWNKNYLAARATVLRPSDIYGGHLLFMLLRTMANCACFIVFMAAFGLIKSLWAVLLLPASTLLGFAFAAPAAAWAVTLDHETAMSYPIRFGAVPLMLFSGTFFPISQLPGWLQPVAYATPLWHGVSLCRALTLGDPQPAPAAFDIAYLVALAVLGLWCGARTYRKRLYV